MGFRFGFRVWGLGIRVWGLRDFGGSREFGPVEEVRFRVVFRPGSTSTPWRPATPQLKNTPAIQGLGFMGP